MPPLAAFAIPDHQLNNVSDLCSSMLKSGRARAVIRSRIDGDDYLIILSDKGTTSFIEKNGSYYPIDLNEKYREAVNASKRFAN